MKLFRMISINYSRVCDAIRGAERDEECVQLMGYQLGIGQCFYVFCACEVQQLLERWWLRHFTAALALFVTCLSSQSFVLMKFTLHEVLSLPEFGRIVGLPWSYRNATRTTYTSRTCMVMCAG